MKSKDDQKFDDADLLCYEVERKFWAVVFWLMVAALGAPLLVALVHGAVILPPPFPILLTDVRELVPERGVEGVWCYRKEGTNHVASGDITRLFIVKFQSESNKQYVLQSSSDLVTWRDVPGIRYSTNAAVEFMETNTSNFGNGGVLMLADGMDDGAKLYRVEVR